MRSKVVEISTTMAGVENITCNITTTMAKMLINRLVIRTRMVMMRIKITIRISTIIEAADTIMTKRSSNAGGRSNHHHQDQDELYGRGVVITTITRVVLSDVLGGKDVIEGRDGRTCRIVIGRIRVKTELHAQIRFYILSLVNTVG
jgi:hypothetical protein